MTRSCRFRASSSARNTPFPTSRSPGTPTTRGCRTSTRAGTNSGAPAAAATCGLPAFDRVDQRSSAIERGVFGDGPLQQRQRFSRVALPARDLAEILKRERLAQRTGRLEQRHRTKRARRELELIELDGALRDFRADLAILGVALVRLDERARLAGPVAQCAWCGPRETRAWSGASSRARRPLCALIAPSRSASASRPAVAEPM